VELARAAADEETADLLEALRKKGLDARGVPLTVLAGPVIYELTPSDCIDDVEPPTAPPRVVRVVASGVALNVCAAVIHGWSDTEEYVLRGPSRRRTAVWLFSRDRDMHPASTPVLHIALESPRNATDSADGLASRARALAAEMQRQLSLPVHAVSYGFRLADPVTPSARELPTGGHSIRAVLLDHSRLKALSAGIHLSWEQSGQAAELTVVDAWGRVLERKEIGWLYGPPMAGPDWVPVLGAATGAALKGAVDVLIARLRRRQQAREETRPPALVSPQGQPLRSTRRTKARRLLYGWWWRVRRRAGRIRARSHRH
jgi:hypothetical protein